MPFVVVGSKSADLLPSSPFVSPWRSHKTPLLVQVTKDVKRSEKADVYSIGILLWELAPPPPHPPPPAESRGKFPSKRACCEVDASDATLSSSSDPLFVVGVERLREKACVPHR